MARSPNLSLPYILPSQAQKHVTHNTALELLDAIVQPCITALDVETPPAQPFEGQLVGVGESATQDFSGQGGKLAYRSGGGWIFISPRNGFNAWVEDQQAFLVFQNGSWRPFRAESPDQLEGLGINTGWDASNRLSVSAPATLFSHDGAGHQLKVNKASSGETASLIFQNAFGGRGEIGLAGDDNLSVKVSPDGANWTRAIAVDATDGGVAVKRLHVTSLTGDAVQQAPDDTRPGRLMRADWGYGAGNLVGTVSESGGVPTGAVLERGSNANGEYVRYADGTQICFTNNLALVQNASFHLRRFWEYPAPFSAQPTVTHAPDLSSATHYATTFAERVYWGSASVKSFGTNAIIDQFKAVGAPDIPAGATLMTSCTALGRWF